MLPRTPTFRNPNPGPQNLRSIALSLAAAVLPLSPNHASDAPLPRFPPLSPTEALASFKLVDGLKIELAASEPLTEDPIAISFDQNGNLFVCEMRGYSERRDEARGRIRMLIDDDRDGTFDRATTYAGNLKWPTALICWDGGVFVAATPDIFYFKDTDGDGVADIKETFFTGFAHGAARLNVQGLMNSFATGPDGRIYGATAHHGGRVTRPDHPKAPPLDLRGRDFSFDPVSLDIRPESGTAQYGLTFDEDGLRYVCSNSSHIEAVFYSWPHADAALPNPLVKIPADGPAAEVFRASPVEPWRILRTRWRIQGKVPGPIEGGGRAAGYFTSASGLCIYRGNALPSEFRGNAFVGDVGSNLVHRKIITKSPDRIHVSASRPDSEKSSEFLTSTDTWFRPVQCQNGPDGALYVVDMYREIIEHPWSLPPGIKEHLDLNSGHDRGRIWRIIPNKPLKKSPPPSSAPTGNPGADLWAAASTLKLEPKTLAGALGDPNPLVRQTAIRIANIIPVPSIDPHPLHLLASDQNPWVRFELALYLTKPENRIPDPLATLSTLTKHSTGDPWIESAIAETAAKRDLVGHLFAAVFPAHRSLPEKLAAKATPADIPTIAELLAASGDISRAATILRALPSLPDTATLQPLIDKAQNSDSPDAIWIAALDPAIPAERFWGALEKNPAAAAATLEALARRASGWKSQALLRWQILPANARDFVLKNLSPEELLDALESKDLAPSEVPIPTRSALRAHGIPAVRERALAAFGPPDPRTRDEIAKHFRPALELAGDPAEGKAIFVARCQLCHEPHGSTEANAGPPTATFLNKGAAIILENIISPNAEFAPQFSAWKLETTDGQSHVGLLGRESANSVTLKLPGRLSTTVPRDHIRSLANLNQSLMPPGLESGLTLQQMADLLAFLSPTE